MTGLRVLGLVKTSIGAEWLVPLMASLQERGHEVLVLLPDPDQSLGRSLRSHGIAVERAPAPVPSESFSRNLRGLADLRKFVRSWQPDVVNYHLYTSALAGRFATAGQRAATVHMVPGPLYLEVPILRTAERILWRLDSRIICSSSSSYRYYHRLGAPHQRLRYVPYSLDFDHFRPATSDERTAAREQLGLPPREFVAVCVAWFYAPKHLVHRGKGLKGHEVLLTAWSRFKRQGLRGHLLLVGGGFGEAGARYCAALERRASTMGLTESVRWLGHVDDVRIAYAAADLNVLASLSENYGSVVEASASGVPSVSTNVGGLPELVIDGATGWVFNTGDIAELARLLAVAAELRSTDELHTMGRRARRLAASLTDKAFTLDEFCRIIEDAAVKSGRP